MDHDRDVVDHDRGAKKQRTKKHTPWTMDLDRDRLVFWA